MIVHSARRAPFQVMFVVVVVLCLYAMVSDWRWMRQKRSTTSVRPAFCRPDMKVRALPRLPDDDWAMLRELFTYLTKPHRAACGKIAQLGGVASRNFETSVTAQDGQKFVCMDPEFTLLTSDRCLAYSFGISTDWTFDWDMERLGCYVYAFDPSIDVETGHQNGSIWFLKYGIGAKDHVNDKGWQIRTLDTFVQYLGHTERTIHYLKMDVESVEYEVLRQQVMRMRDSSLARNVEQIGVELHMKKFLPVYEHMDVYREMYKTFLVMQLMGFYPFHYEKNLVVETDMDVPGIDERLVSAMEVVWLKTKCVIEDA